ncbi:uncharacterized protein LOC143260666 [Megalopta genalis]|uniref:uncharacterized protein LOC143260666 n=1 Tax=Megalopta genalis TaxID=115081 RepID=UPI003FD1F6D4
MLTSGLPDAAEYLIFLLICCCLVSALTWNALSRWLSTPRSPPSRKTPRSRPVESTAARPPRDRRPGGNQFLARTAADGRNHADSVPVKESRAAIDDTVTDKMADNFPTQSQPKTASKDSLRNSTLSTETLLKHRRPGNVPENIEKSITENEDELSAEGATIATTETARDSVQNCRQIVDKLSTHFAVERSDLYRDVREDCSADSKLELAEDPQPLALLPPASFERIDKKPGTGSSWWPSEKMIRSERSGSTERCFGNGFGGTDSAEANEESREAAPRRSKMAVDSPAERLSLGQRDAEICPRMGADYPGEQFGVRPEEGENRIEEKSITRSYENSAGSRGQGKEEEEAEEVEEEGEVVVGPFPVTDSLRNDREDDLAISLAPAPPGKEEEDLNTIIRHMIITELRKHRTMERTILKRVYSDPVSMSPKKHGAKNRSPQPRRPYGFPRPPGPGRKPSQKD